MEIIAKTKDGFLIRGSTSEVEEILRSVQGTVPDEIPIGQKIPAIDYSATITKLKALPQDYKYRQLISYAEQFNEFITDLQNAVNGATEL